MTQRLPRVLGTAGIGWLLAGIAWAQDKPTGVQLVEVARLKTEITSFHDVLLTPGGDLLIVQDVLGAVEAWDVAKQRRLWAKNTGSYAHHLSASAEEMVWVRQSRASRAIVHTDLRTGKQRKRTPLEIEPVKLWNAVFGWGQAPVLAAQAEYQDRGQIVTFSVETGKLLSRCNMPAGDDGTELGIQGLGVSADGMQLLVTMPGGVLLCDRDGQALHRYRTASHVARLRFLPDGKRALACGTTFGSPLYFLDLVAGKITEHRDHRFGTASLEVSADGKWAVTGGQCRFAAERNYSLRTHKSEGGEVILWDLTANQPVSKLNPFVDSVKGVGISRDGRWLAAAETGDESGQVVVFKVTGAAEKQ